MPDSNKSLNILVVEDNPGDLLLLEESLHMSPLFINAIYKAGNMRDIAAVIENKVIDIALLDLTLPDSTGINSVIMLDKLLPKTPIIVLSGLSDIEIGRQSISLGAQDFLVKGEFDQKLFYKCIRYSIERKKNLEKLKESNDRFELVNKATLDTIWEWNFATNSGIWGDGIIRTFGYTEDDLTYYDDWSVRFIHPDDFVRVVTKINQSIVNKIENLNDEYRFKAADTSYRYVYCRTHILYNDKGKPYVMIGAIEDITQRRRLEKELSKQRVNQQKLITEVSIQAQEKERDQLGKELHDNINQILATVKMYLGLIKGKKNADPHLLDRSYEFVNEAIEEIRKLSKTLITPSIGESGLKRALQMLIHDVNIIKGLSIQLYYKMEEGLQISDKEELMLYRIVQEQINNISKHAKASHADIHITSENGSITLTIEDDGIGFDTNQISNGIGLQNIKSRINFYSGTMNITSAPGKGFKLEIKIP